jgi:hypothetical protein
MSQVHPNPRSTLNESMTRAGAALVAIAALFAITVGSASASGARSFHHPVPPRSFHPPAPPRSNHPVFVQTDNPAGNQIVAYDQAANGSLTQAGTYDTGGLGGVLEGSVVDHLASQGSLANDRDNGLLYAVNAGSNSVSVFSVFGDRLTLHQVISSGGAFPVSVAIDHGLVYVLNAREGGSVQGYRVGFGHLFRSWGRVAGSVSIPPRRRSSSTRRARSPSLLTARS